MKLSLIKIILLLYFVPVMAIKPFYLKNLNQTDIAIALALTNEISQKYKSTIEAFTIAIVFPEFIRYSMLRDILEQSAVEISYVHFGTQKMDFSIGPCQMKLSFIEQIEKDVQNNPTLYKKYSSLISYPGTDTTVIRKKRFDKTCELNYQLQYLQCFIELMDIKTQDTTFINQTDKLHFYATAYNCGYTMPLNEIEKFKNARCFPYGSHISPKKQYVYGDISVYFFNYCNTLNN